MSAKKNECLREILNRPGILPLPGCHDAFTARIVEKTGFEVCYAGGNGMMASLIGRADMGLATATEMVDQSRRIAACLDIPLICDADTGYGNLNNVYRTVRDFEAAGVSGIQIEDQDMPKKCGSMGDLVLIEPQAMVDKIKMAQKAREDSNFVIIARTDAFRPLGYDEMLRRCVMYYEAGADVIMPCGLHDPELMQRLVAELQAPFQVEVCEFNKDRYIFSDKELEEIGYKIALRPLSSILYAARTFSELYSHYKENGSTRLLHEQGQFMNQTDYQNIIGHHFETHIRELID